MSELKCVVCQASLTGELDTYGHITSPRCRECWLSGALSPEEELARERSLKGEIEDTEYLLQENEQELRSCQEKLKHLKAESKRLKASLLELRQELDR